MKLKVICEICGEVFAEIDTGFLSFPMTGAMFKSPDPFHSVPDPFDSRLTWEDFRCPFGRSHRPMIKPNALLLMSDAGTKRLVELPEDGTPPNIMATPKAVDKDNAADLTRGGGNPTPSSDEQTDVGISPALPEKKWVCDVCGKELKSGLALAGHKRSHKK